MSEKFILEQGSLQGLEFDLKDQTEWTLGNDPSQSSLLVDDPLISDKQFFIQKTQDGILLSNLSDSSPTLINGEETLEPTLLKDGDTITVGDQTFRYFQDQDSDVFEDDESVFFDDATEEEDEKVSEGFELKPVTPESAPNPTVPVDTEETFPSINSSDNPSQHPFPQDPSSEPTHDSIYDDKKNINVGHSGLAEINFDLLDAGRYLLKVMSGPNNGAEFSMEVGTTYLIGTDPNSCDIVFHDTSVSRQHARLSVSDEEEISIEDLKSRNGTLVDGKAIEAKLPLSTNSVVTVGTTSFVVYDREGNMQTIISPLLPEIVKVLQRDEEKQLDEDSKPEPVTAFTPPPPPKEKPIGAFIAIAMITGLFVLMAIGTTSLFKSEPIELIDNSNADAQLDAAITKPFNNSIKYSYNKATGRLLLVGHVLTVADKNQLKYNLDGMRFISNIDDSGVVIDELVWRSQNDILNKNPDWRGITIQSPEAGKFVLTGYLQTRKQAEGLYNYLSSSFPYLDRLDRALVVDEELVQTVTNMLANKDIRSVNVQFSNGDLILTGGVAASKQDAFLELQNDFKKIPGIRQVRSQVSNLVTDTGTMNVSDRYEVSGYSKQGNVINVVINGRIVTRGDTLDGMIIKSISPSTIILEKDSVSYRIDYNR